MTDISLSFLICSRSSSSRSCKREHANINQLLFKVWLIFHPPCIIALSWSHSRNTIGLIPTITLCPGLIPIMALCPGLIPIIALCPGLIPRLLCVGLAKRLGSIFLRCDDHSTPYNSVRLLLFLFLTLSLLINLDCRREDEMKMIDHHNFIKGG